MQTFLPEDTFKKSARCLDRQRLGKQRVEAAQIFETLHLGLSAWSNHPAVKMWKGYEYQLCDYGIAVCKEWISRGYEDKLLEKFKVYQRRVVMLDEIPWYNDKLITSHRSNLLRKFPVYYKHFNWGVPDNLDYWWPVT